MNTPYPFPSYVRLVVMDGDDTQTATTSSAFDVVQQAVAHHLGLVLMGQVDSIGRMVSYGYHWHIPDTHGACSNPIFLGYETPAAALAAGLRAGFAAGVTIDLKPDTDDYLPDSHLLARCVTTIEKEDS